MEDVAANTGPIDPASYALAFRQIQERLIVMTRESSTEARAKSNGACGAYQ